MGLRDYVRWHDEYDQPGSRLWFRGLVVEHLLAAAFDAAEPGPITLVSMCAGQGRDVATVVARHRRGGDVRGRLVELDPHNAAVARELVGGSAIEVVEGDAGSSDAYAGVGPADVVLACGVFGNIDDAAIERTISFLPRLCAPGAVVLWTRYPDPPDIVSRIEGWLRAAGFEPGVVIAPPELSFAVGSARLVGDVLPFQAGVRLFEFFR